VKNKTFLFLQLIFLFFAVTGCEQLNNQNEAQNKDYSSVSFSVDNNKSASNARATFYPELYMLTDYDTFEILGKYEFSETTRVLGTFETYSDLQNKVFTLETGEWIFYLNVYKTISGVSEKLAAATVSKTLSAGTSFGIDFTLEPVNDNSKQGTLECEITIPVYGASKVGVTVSAVAGSGTEEEYTFTLKAPYYGAGFSKQLNPGAYFVKLDFKKSDGTKISSRLEYVKISSHLSTKASFQYEDINNTYNIMYCHADGSGSAFNDWNPGFTPVSEYNKSTTVVLPTAANIDTTDYEFGGWYETSDFSTPQVTEIPAGTTKIYRLYAKEYNTVSLKDRNKGAVYTGTGNNFVEVYRGKTFTLTDEYESSLSTVENPVSLLCWENNNGGTLEQISSLSGKKSELPSEIYAHWVGKYVYINPALGTASDENSGFSADSPVKTVTEAKELLRSKNFASGKHLYVMSDITDVVQIRALSGLTDNAYGNADAYSYSGNGIVSITSPESATTISLSNVTFDGGALNADGTFNEWRNSDSLIKIFKTAAISPELELNAGVIIRNARSNNSTFWGGGINCRDSILSLYDVVIENCRAARGGGVSVTGTVSEGGGAIEMQRTVFKYCNSPSMGGAIYIGSNVQNEIINSEFIGNTTKTDGYGPSIYSVADELCLKGTTYADTAVYLAKISDAENYSKIVLSDYVGTSGKITQIVPHAYASIENKIVILKPASGKSMSQTECNLFNIANDTQGILYNIKYDDTDKVGYLNIDDEGVNIRPSVPTVTEYSLGTIENNQTVFKKGETIKLIINPALIVSGSEYIDTTKNCTFEYINMENTELNGVVTGPLSNENTEFTFSISDSGIYNITISAESSATAKQQNIVITAVMATVIIISE